MPCFQRVTVMGCGDRFAKLCLDDAGSCLVDGLVAIQPQADRPPADVEALADGGDHVIRQCTGFVVPLLARGQHCGTAQPAADGRRLLQQAIATHGGNDIHGPAQVVGILEFEIEADHRLGRRHQPDASLGDHAVVRLHEHLFPRRAKAVAVEIPGGRTAHRAHAGTHQFAGGQHHFHAAELFGVLSVRGVAHAPIHGIAQHRAPAVAGHAGPVRQLVLLDVFVEIVEPDSGLHQRDAILCVELDLLHARQVEHHRTLEQWRRAAIAEVLAAADGPQRHLVAVGHAQHFLHLCCGQRRYRSRWRMRCFIHCKMIEIGIAVQVGGKHPLVAHDLREVLQRAIQLRSRKSRRQYQLHQVTL